MYVPDGFTIRLALRKYFEGWIYARGQSYYATGRVHECAAAPGTGDRWLVQAKVMGSEPEPYRVQIALSPRGPSLHIESSCTCPFGGGCKHAVAALLYTANHDVRLFGPPSRGTTPQLELENWKEQAPVHPAFTLDPRWVLWLNKLEADVAAEGKVETKPPQPQQRSILYVLQPRYKALAIQLQSVRLLKKGGFGGLTVCSLTDLAKEAAGTWGVTPEDRSLLRKILVDSGQFGAVDINIQPHQGADWLKDILATGRCYWQDPRHFHEPLRLGAARPARPVWKPGANGEQTPTLDIDPPAEHLLLLKPLWYLSLSTRECGPVETGLPDAVARAWLDAPPVRPENARIVSEALSSRQASLRLPTPLELQIKDVAGVKPTPCLRLYSALLKPRFSWGTSDLDKEYSFAALEFDYAGFRVTAEHPPVVTTSERNIMRRLVRDLNTEEAARNILFEHGFSFADARIFEHDFGKNGKHLVLEDPVGWFEFARDLLPRLEAEGWRIERDENFRFRIAEPEDWYSDAAAQSGNQWFEVELGVVLEGQKINLLPVIIKFLQMNPQLLSKEQLDAAGDTTVPVALPDGRLIGFPMERIRGTLGVLLDLLNPGALNKKGRLKISRIRAAELAGETGWRWMGSQELQDFAKRLRGFEGIQSITPPAGLQTQLRPYQQEGLNWLQFLREYQLAGILADDMGLGKTIQALAHLLVEKDSGRADHPSLVVAPTSLMTNWRQETERFAPQLKVLVLHGQDRKQHFDRIKDHDFIV